MTTYNVSFVYENIILIATVEMEEHSEVWNYAEDVHIPDLFENKGKLLEISVDRDEVYPDEK
jgi:hypothetical protein